VVKAYAGRFDLEQTVVDGANKQAVEEMNQRHGTTLDAADKRDKFEFVDIMNDDFIRERIYVSTAEWEPERMPEFTDPATCGTEDYVSRQKCGLLMTEFAKLVLDERKLLKSRKREEHPNCENHCADATLYPWRRTYPYLSTVIPKVAARVGSHEWLVQLEEQRRREMDELMEQEIAEARERSREEGEPGEWLNWH
jgi:hypothetical protein